MSEANGQRPSVASYAPRHQRQDPPLPPLPEDPFVLPDPVEEQLRRWRAERATPADPATNGSPDADTEPGAHPSDPVTPEPDIAEADIVEPDIAEAEIVEPDVAEAEIAEQVAPGPDITEPAGFASAPSTHPNAFAPPTPVDFGPQTDHPRPHTDFPRPPAEFANPAAPFVPPAPGETIDRNGAIAEAAPGAGVVPGWQTPIDGSESQTVSLRAQAQAPAAAAAPTVGGPIAIEARNLHKRFKDMVAVEDVSFTVPAGSIVALLGPNGAGKTTTVNMLCTLLKPDGGAATVNGHDVAAESASVRKSIMLTGQFAALDEALTGRENLVLFGRLLGLDKAAARVRADELLDAFSLTDVGGKRVREYSGGMRRRIDIACGLVTAPKIVFLDEPTTGLDPRSRLEVWALVEKLRDSGVTILLTTQYLEEADVLSDNIVVIDKGRVIAEGTSDELKASTGAAYCEVTPADPADRTRLRATLADLIGDHTQEDDDHFVAVPAPDGPETLVEVIRRTADAGIPLSDVAMRRPSLDEVFLALTDPRRDRSSR
ncbi:ATP-binding cassette domain-containing protein [Gordonia terrae]|uniref:ATP-binding cassette domain-containing protein n=1 Tax=Gordonia terrae TaxID=2055 RepID=UPI003F6CC187